MPTGISKPLVPESSSVEVEVTVEKLKRCKSPRLHQFPAELIQVGCNTLRSESQKLINSIWKKDELP
jgi:hypothetical protein